MPRDGKQRIPTRARSPNVADIGWLQPSSRRRDVRVVFGLLGAGSETGRWRLYLSLAFDEYLEFSRTDVVHAQRLTEAESRIGGTAVWLARDSELVHVRTTSRERQRDFLQGEISRRHLSRVTTRPTPSLLPGIDAFAAGGCHTGGALDTLCAACTAVPTALIARDVRAWTADD